MVRTLICRPILCILLHANLPPNLYPIKGIYLEWKLVTSFCLFRTFAWIFHKNEYQIWCGSLSHFDYLVNDRYQSLVSQGMEVGSVFFFLLSFFLLCFSGFFFEITSVWASNVEWDFYLKKHVYSSSFSPYHIYRYVH